MVIVPTLYVRRSVAYSRRRKYLPSYLLGSMSNDAASLVAKQKKPRKWACGGGYRVAVGNFNKWFHLLLRPKEFPPAFSRLNGLPLNWKFSFFREILWLGSIYCQGYRQSGYYCSQKNQLNRFLTARLFLPIKRARRHASRSEICFLFPPCQCFFLTEQSR